MSEKIYFYEKHFLGFVFKLLNDKILKTNMFIKIFSITGILMKRLFTRSVEYYPSTDMVALRALEILNLGNVTLAKLFNKTKQKFNLLITRPRSWQWVAPVYIQCIFPTFIYCHVPNIAAVGTIFNEFSMTRCAPDSNSKPLMLLSVHATIDIR